jgi:hypothetical protein
VGFRGLCVQALSATLANSFFISGVFMVTRMVAKKVGKTRSAVVRGVKKTVTDALAGALHLRGERMSNVDTAWLHMDWRQPTS